MTKSERVYCLNCKHWSASSYVSRCYYVVHINLHRSVYPEFIYGESDKLNEHGGCKHYKDNLLFRLRKLFRRGVMY